MVLVLKLDDYEWGYTDENIASLIDREDYWLNAEYQSWTTDPEDPEIKKSPRTTKKIRGQTPTQANHLPHSPTPTARSSAPGEGAFSSGG
ncbi:hypothetical protein ACQX2Y_09415 [Corynebacterium diphtheriae]